MRRSVCKTVVFEREGDREEIEDSSSLDHGVELMTRAIDFAPLVLVDDFAFSPKS